MPLTPRVPFPQCPVTRSTLPCSFLENKVFKTLNSKITSRILHTYGKAMPFMLQWSPAGQAKEATCGCFLTCSASHEHWPTASGRGKLLLFHDSFVLSIGLTTEGQIGREQLWPDLMKALHWFPIPLLLFQTHSQRALSSNSWEEITRKSSLLCVNTTVAETSSCFSGVI